MAHSYCVKCKAHTDSHGETLHHAHGRHSVKSKCSRCHGRKSRFVSSRAVKLKKGGSVFRSPFGSHGYGAKRAKKSGKGLMDIFKAIAPAAALFL